LIWTTGSLSLRVNVPYKVREVKERALGTD
jgi:hypothetical protein